MCSGSTSWRCTAARWALRREETHIYLTRRRFSFSARHERRPGEGVVVRCAHAECCPILPVRGSWGPLYRRRLASQPHSDDHPNLVCSGSLYQVLVMKRGVSAEAPSGRSGGTPPTLDVDMSLEIVSIAGFVAGIGSGAVDMKGVEDKKRGEGEKMRVERGSKVRS